jgi:hypothetical protein
VLLQDQGIGLKPVAYHARMWTSMRYITMSTNKGTGNSRRSTEILLLLTWCGGIYGNHGPRHVATLLSAARFVNSTSAMATSFSALSATDGHRVQEGSSQPCRLWVSPTLPKGLIT